MKFFDALRGGPAQPADSRDMLAHLYGHGRRGGVNTKAAAQDLGVSERTVRRWAREGLPASVAADKLRSEHSRWEDTPAGRENALGGRLDTFRDSGAAVTMVGGVIISGDDRGTRQLNMAFDPAEMALLADVAIHGGGEADMKAAMEYLVGQKFGGSVDLNLNQLDFS